MRGKSEDSEAPAGNGKAGKKRKLDTATTHVQKTDKVQGDVVGGKKRTLRKKKRVTLHEEFKNIIESAQSIAVNQAEEGRGETEMTDNLPFSTSKRQPGQSTSRKEVTETSNDTPLPSPIAPSRPAQRVANKKGVKDDSMTLSSPTLSPSPSSVHGTPSSQSSNQSFHHVTQATFKKEEPQGVQDDEENVPHEITQFDLQVETGTANTSMNECGKGLDLDNLIEEIFVKETTALGRNLLSEDVPSPSLGFLSELPLGSMHPQKYQLPILSKDEPGFPTETSDELKNTVCSIYSKFQGSSSNDKEYTNGLTVNLGEEIMKKTHENHQSVSHEQLSKVAATKKVTKDIECQPDKKSEEDKEMYTMVTQNDGPTGKNITVSSDTIDIEEFCDDLSLSNSLLLDIDAKCNQLRDSFGASNDALIELDAKDSCISQDEPKVHESSEQVTLDVSNPPAPSTNWIQKILNSCQSLRRVTQEISRLNALVLRARKTLWPQQDNQVAVSPAVAAQPKTSHHCPNSRSQHPHIMTDEPEWNIN